MKLSFSSLPLIFTLLAGVLLPHSGDAQGLLRRLFTCPRLISDIQETLDESFSSFPWFDVENTTCTCMNTGVLIGVEVSCLNLVCSSSGCNEVYNLTVNQNRRSAATEFCWVGYCMAFDYSKGFFQRSFAGKAPESCEFAGCDWCSDSINENCTCSPSVNTSTFPAVFTSSYTREELGVSTECPAP